MVKICGKGIFTSINGMVFSALTAFLKILVNKVDKGGTQYLYGVGSLVPQDGHRAFLLVDAGQIICLQQGFEGVNASNCLLIRPQMTTDY